MTLTIDREGRVAVVTVDNPPVNALSQRAPPVALGRGETLDADPDVDAVVLICSPGAPSSPGPTLPSSASRRCRRTCPTSSPASRAPRSPGSRRSMAPPWRRLRGGARLPLPHRRPDRLGRPSRSHPWPRSRRRRHRPPASPCAARRRRGLATTGKPVKAAKALELGLLDRVIEGDLRAEAIAFAAETRPCPPPCGSASPIAADPDFWEEAERQCGRPPAARPRRSGHSPPAPCQRGRLRRRDGLRA